MRTTTGPDVELASGVYRWNQEYTVPEDTRIDHMSFYYPGQIYVSSILLNGICLAVLHYNVCLSKFSSYYGAFELQYEG